MKWMDSHEAAHRDADRIRKALDGPQGDAGSGVALESTGEPQGPQSDRENR